MKKMTSGLIAGVFASAMAGPAVAVDEIFLRLDTIRGESPDKNHRDEIEVLSYTQSVRGAPVGGKPMCGTVTILKYVDMASPDLILNALNGRHITKAVITFRRPGPTPIEYYKVTLEDVVVAEVEQNDTKLNFPNPAPPRATEKVTLMGRRFHYEYYAMTPDGRPGGQPKAGWDCAAASKV